MFEENKRLRVLFISASKICFEILPSLHSTGYLFKRKRKENNRPKWKSIKKNHSSARCNRKEDKANNNGVEAECCLSWWMRRADSSQRLWGKAVGNGVRQNKSIHPCFTKHGCSKWHSPSLCLVLFMVFFYFEYEVTAHFKCVWESLLYICR